MDTCLTFDGDLIITGTPDEITEALWANCRAHVEFLSLQDYMDWQARILREFLQAEIRTTDTEEFVADLVYAGFLIPVN